MNKIKTVLQKFPDSAREMGSLRTITVIAMLLAVSVVLSFFTIHVSETLRMGLGYLITAALGMLFGPVTAGVAAGLGDIVKFLIKPTGFFFPGFTITAILGGVLYGVIFYHSRVTLVKSVLAKVLSNVFLNIMLNTLWNSILMGQGFWALLPARIIKNVALLPVEIALLYTMLRLVTAIALRLPASPARTVPSIPKK